MQLFSSLQRRTEQAHRAYLKRIWPSDMDETSEQADEIVRLVNLSLIAFVTALFFVVELARHSLWAPSFALAAAGIPMVCAPFIYRLSGSITLARELMLASAFAFKTYESIYFASIISPGSMWFSAIPVMAILMGSALSGLAWVLTAIVTVVALTSTLEGRVTFMGDPASSANEIYALSLIFLVVALATFTLMVDHGRKRAYRRLADATETVRNLAIRDPLTGAFNRRYIWEHLQREENRVRTSRWHSSILLIDIDHFKNINDRYGHPIGDIVIKAVSDAIASQVEGEDCFGRYGGEEFICVVRMQAPGDHLVLAERIRRCVASLTFEAGTIPETVTVSIGVASLSPADAVAKTLADADAALYAAKAGGRNRVRSAASVRQTEIDPSSYREASAA